MNVEKYQKFYKRDRCRFYKKVLDVENIVSVFYYEHIKKYTYKNDAVDYWKMIFVDKGEVDIISGNNGYSLKSGDIIFHKPYEITSLFPSGNVPPNVMAINFYCNSTIMQEFENCVLTLPTEKYKYIRQFMIETSRFSESMGDLTNFDKNHLEIVFGAEQTMYGLLELFLISILRDEVFCQCEDHLRFNTHERLETEMVSAIIDYLKNNIDKKITINKICEEFYLSPTKAKTVFKKEMGKGIISYFNQMKMERAKEMIKEKKYTFTEIAYKLGFEDIHYFSRCFKKTWGMTPSFYSSSL